MIGDVLSVILFTLTLVVAVHWSVHASRWHLHLERGASEEWSRKQPEFKTVYRMLPVILLLYTAAIVVKFVF